MKAVQNILLEEIDLSDQTFSVNYLPDLQRLRSSIEKIGLIQPVLLKRKRSRYQIISGFRRISVMKTLGKLEIESRLVEEKEADEFHLFSLSFHENLTTRGFNTVEKATVLDKLVHQFHIGSSVVIDSFLPLLDLQPNEKILNTYLSLARMEDEIKQYVRREEVSRFNIRKLSAFSPDDRKAFLFLAFPLKLGENRLREILTLLEEISRRNRSTVIDICSKPEIQGVLSQEELTPSQRTDRIKKVLTNLRYPKLHRLEEGFEKKKKELNLHSKVLLQHSPFFEGKGGKIEFQFENMKDYRSIIASLLKLADKKEFEEILEE